jgi:murein DD-endopeptidase MepM/ murein hydrolase activator NlpD
MVAPVKGPIGTPYGKPGKWAWGKHPGDDYPVPVGTRVTAPAASTIIFAGRYGSGSWGGRDYGNHVVGECIVNGVRYQWIVAHLSKVLVKKGQHVAAGQIVGLSGNTGRTTGPHVHFEVRAYPFNYANKFVNPAVLINHKPGPVDKMDPQNYGPGHSGQHITWLGTQLVKHGFGEYYTQGPGPVWGNADRANVREFQKAQGWSGLDADGLPGKETLKRLAVNP